MDRFKDLAVCAVFTAVFALTTVGCKSKVGDSTSAIVGTWAFDSAPSGADVGYTFKHDGSYLYWFKGTKIDVQSSGGYALDGNNLTLDQRESISTAGKLNSTPQTIKIDVKRISENRIQLSDGETWNTWTRRAK